MDPGLLLPHPVNQFLKMRFIRIARTRRPVVSTLICTFPIRGARNIVKILRQQSFSAGSSSMLRLHGKQEVGCVAIVGFQQAGAHSQRDSSIRKILVGYMPQTKPVPDIILTPQADNSIMTIFLEHSDKILQFWAGYFGYFMLSSNFFISHVQLQ